MSCQLADRYASRYPHTSPQRQAFCIAIEYVREEPIHDMQAVRWQHTGQKLIPQQIEVACCEVKQRTDARVRLPVIVSQRTFEVAKETGDAVIGSHLPITREGLIDLEFDCPVAAKRVHESVRNAVWNGSSRGSHAVLSKTCKTGAGISVGVSNVLAQAVGDGELRCTRSACCWCVRKVAFFIGSASWRIVYLNGVRKQVSLGVNVGNQENLLETGIRCLRRNTAGILNNPLEVATDEFGCEYHSLWELVFVADNPL